MLIHKPGNKQYFMNCKLDEGFEKQRKRSDIFPI